MHHGAVARMAVDSQLSAEEDRPFPHASGPHAFRPMRIRFDASAVVTDDERHLGIGIGLQNDANRVRTAVASHVGERLFDDAIKVDGRRRGQRRRPSRNHTQLSADASLLFKARGESSDRAYKAVAHARFATKVMEELTEGLENLSSRVLNRVQLPQDVIPANRLGLEILKLHEHPCQRLGDAVVQLPRHNSPYVFLDVSS